MAIVIFLKWVQGQHGSVNIQPKSPKFNQILEWDLQKGYSIQYSIGKRSECKEVGRPNGLIVKAWDTLAIMISSRIGVGALLNGISIFSARSCDSDGWSGLGCKKCILTNFGTRVRSRSSLKVTQPKCSLISYPSRFLSIRYIQSGIQQTC